MPELNNETDFDAAFDLAIESVGKDPAPAPAEPAPAGGGEGGPAGGEPAAAPAADPAPAPAAEPAAAPAADPAPAPAAEPAAPAASAPDPAPTPAPAPAPAAQPAPAPAADPAPAPVEIPDPELTAEEKAAREQFAKDWPDHAVALEKRETFFKQQMEANFTRAISAVAQKIYEDFAPFAKVAADTSRKTFREYVLEKHADFDEVKPKLEGWIKEQPPYLRDAYTRAYTDGTAEEVADLTKRFKDATGVKPQAPSTPAQPTPRASNDGKADALAPVNARRTKPEPSGPDMTDFDTAFDEAAQATPK